MKIEFVDYTGSWPNLCSGTLILRIDGEIYSFGGYVDEDDPDRDSHCFSQFWTSGGSCGWEPDDWIEEGDWIQVEDLPDFLKGHEDEIMSIMNSNVPHGCCGGCI